MCIRDSGYTLADRTDRYREALELISRALAAQPDNAAIIDSHGWVLYRLGKPTEALSELRRAFTSTLFKGTPAAVLVLDHALGDDDMLAIAAENNLAETAFVERQGSGWTIRWFTPCLLYTSRCV